MHKLDSMWYHEAPGNGKLASSHIAVSFCALAISNMIDTDLLAMEFDKMPSDLSNRSFSPLDYCLAYTDGEILDIYIKAKYRKLIAELFDSNRIFEVLFELEGLEHDHRYETYTLKCNWHNVDVFADWLRQQFA